MKSLIPLLLSMVSCAGLFAACERSSDLANVELLSIEPSRVMLTDTRRVVELEAVGGNPPFQWTVADEEAGTLVSSGRTAVYTAIGDSGGNIVTVTDERYWTATATILQGSALAISATDTTIATNGSSSLVAEGGTGSYTWLIQTSPASGTLSSTSGPTTTYSSTGAGTDVVLLSDGESSVAVTIVKN